MRHICASIVAALVLAGTTTAATINVPADYTTIQAAVNAASDGDEILVAPGTYTGTGAEVVDMLGKAITLRSSGTAEETILDGESVNQVVRCTNGETSAAVLEGFTITGGFSESFGGGIYCSNSSPTITGCTISNNTAGSSGGGYGGGGISCYGGSPTLTDCVIENNTASGHGGGIRCSGGSSPTISGCTFSNNTAGSSGGGYGGGGISCYGGSPTLTDCVIENNTASGHGGGIRCSGGSSPTISDCTISNNTAGSSGGGYGGGGISCSGGSPMISNSTVCGNDPDQIAGDWIDSGGNTISAECPPDCPDVSGDGLVGMDDVFAVVAAWGSDDPDADVNGDGIVGTDDLLAVIGAWGPCE